MTTRYSFIDVSVGRILHPFMPSLGVAALGAALAGLCSLGGLWQIVRLIKDPGALPAIWAIAAWILGALLATGSAWLSHAAEGRFEAKVRREVAAHMMRLPVQRLVDVPADRLRRLASDDVAALHHMVAHLPSEIAGLVVIPACAVVLLLLLGGPLALFALVPGVLAAILYLSVIPRRSAKHGAQREKVMGEITSAVDDYAHGIHVYRTFGAGAGALTDYAAATRRFTTGMLTWVGQVAAPAAIAGAFLQAIASDAIAYAVSGERDPSVLAATLLFSLALVTPALRLAHGLDYVAAGRSAATRIGELLREPILASGDLRLGPGAGDVMISNLTVNIGSRRVFDGVNAQVSEAAVTVVTGPSGVGKSTLLRIVAGLQEAERGTVRVSGIEVCELRESDRAEGILLIPQGSDSLSASLGENLRLVAPEASDEACSSALLRAQLPMPLDTDAAELSGGESQRLSIARAFLSQAPVVLLDEPTSALDESTALRLWEELETLAREDKRTLIIVTHDNRLAGRADRVIDLAPVSEPQEGLSR